MSQLECHRSVRLKRAPLGLTPDALIGGGVGFALSYYALGLSGFASGVLCVAWALLALFACRKRLPGHLVHLARFYVRRIT